MSGYGLSSRAIIGEFYRVLEADPGMEWINAISMLFNSDQESETYKWLGMVPAMRQWLGGRQAKGFRENGIAIENLEFEATLEVLVKELRRDKTGQIMIRVAELAESANLHWAELLSTLIEAGESTNCYDGQFFFDTDHTEGDNSTAQSNDLAITLSGLPVATHGTSTAPSVGDMQQCILRAVQAILGFKDDQNRPMNEAARQFRVMVPTPLWATAEAACGSALIDGGNTNTIQTIRSRIVLTPVVNPRLTWTTKFAVFRGDGRVKPLIRQEEVPIQVDAIAEGSEEEFKNKRHLYGVSASRNVGYGYWQHGCLVTMS